MLSARGYPDPKRPSPRLDLDLEKLCKNRTTYQRSRQLTASEVSVVVSRTILYYYHVSLLPVYLKTKTNLTGLCVHS